MSTDTDRQIDEVDDETAQSMGQSFEDVVAALEAKRPELRETREAYRPIFELRMALLHARLAAGLTQAAMAERLGTKQSTIARWETGAQMPTVVTLHRIAKVLGVDFIITAQKPLEARKASAA